jgi:hypothetical protein
MTSVGEVDIKERISLTRQEYSILKENMKYDECGWSNPKPGETGPHIGRLIPIILARIGCLVRSGRVTAAAVVRGGKESGRHTFTTASGTSLVALGALLHQSPFLSLAIAMHAWKEHTFNASANPLCAGRSVPEGTSSGCSMLLSIVMSM